MRVTSRVCVASLALALEWGCNGDAVDPQRLNLTPAGGVFTFANVTVTVPEGAVTSDHELVMALSEGTPVSARMVGLPVSVTISPATVLLKAATVEVTFDSLPIPDRIPAATLGIYQLDGTQWAPLGSTVNLGDSAVSAQASTGGDFALLGLRAESIAANSAVAQQAQPGTAVGSPPSVAVTDSSGAPLEGASVAFAVTAGGGSVSPTSKTTDAAGVATADSWVVGPDAGTVNELTAAVGDLGPVTFSATTDTGSTSLGDIVWFSDWRFATGQGVTAVQDGADAGSYKWDAQSGNPGEQLTVIPSTGLGFPAAMTNVLQINFNGAIGGTNHDSQMAAVANMWSLIGIGETIYYRFYIRYSLPDDPGVGEPHFIQSGSNATWEFLAQYGPAYGTGSGQWALDFAYWHSVEDLYGFNHYWVVLSDDTVYRVEFALQRNATNQATVDHIYIYDESISSTTPQYTDADFVHSGGNNIPTDGQHLDLSVVGPDAVLREIYFGNNGPVMSAGDKYIYGGGVAVSLSNWCGPYTVIGG